MVLVKQFKIQDQNDPVFNEVYSRDSVLNISLKYISLPNISISVLGPFLWIILPDEYKISTSLKDFKTKIKNWVSLNCPCRFCKTYIQNVRFI